MILIDNTFANYEAITAIRKHSSDSTLRIVNFSSRVIFVENAHNPAGTSNNIITSWIKVLNKNEYYEVTILGGLTGSRVYSLDGAIDVKIGGSGILIIPESGKPFVVENWSTVYGYGIPDVARALDLEVSEPQLLPESNMNNNRSLNLFNALEAWNAGFDGTGVKIAVLDTGILSHQEVTPVLEYDFWEDDNDTTPDYNILHGISVASIIAGKREIKETPDITGIAHGAEILDIRIGGSTTSWTKVNEAIKFSVNNGAKVIQMSFSVDGASVSEISEGIEYAIEHNVLVVFASSNSGSTKPGGFSGSGNTYPIITVSDLNVNTLEPFQHSDLAGTIEFPYFFAPSGGWYPAENNEYVNLGYGGGSYAAPYISGIAAIIFQKYPDITLEELIDKMKEASWIPEFSRTNEIQWNGGEFVRGTSLTDILYFDFISSQVTELYASNKSILPDVRLKLKNGSEIGTFQIEKFHFSDNIIATPINQISVDDSFQLMYAYHKGRFFDDHHVRGLVINLIEDLDKSEVPWFINEYLFGQSDDLMPSLLLAAENVFGWSSETTEEWVDDFLVTSGTTLADAFWHIAESETANEQIRLLLENEYDYGMIWYDDVSLI